MSDTQPSIVPVPHELSEQPWDALQASLLTRFQTVVTPVTVAGRKYELLRPRSADDLLDEDDYDRHQRVPYWAELWPSALALAQRLAAAPGQGRTLLELGSGLGLVSLVAAQHGYQVLATDYYAEALEFLRVNACRAGLVEPARRVVDWRYFPSDLVTFDVVVAADVLYERPMCGLIADAILRTLRPGGSAIVTDPCRKLAEAFPQHCTARGLKVRSVEEIPTPTIEGKTQTIRIYTIER